jgi:hypothetical protein
MTRLALSVLVLLAAVPRLAADGPKDNLPDNVRPIPPKGVEVPEADLAELQAGLAELGKEVAALAADPKNAELLPDVEVYHKAVRYAVEYGEFFNLKEVPVAKAHLKTGLQRARELKAGKPSWTTATGLVVRGYRSKIDGSVQPYGLVVPKEYDPKGKRYHRLDFWWHGRGETLSEVNFIQQRQTSPGEFTPEGAFVLHPYGRYCNANKFAGEVDTQECLEHVRKHYRIDEDRIVARGFSMGGAACWQFAVHYPTLWCAAAPGAGFAETPEFLNVFQNEKVEPTWYEQKLWRMYNATDSAVNLFNLPTVAYSGENDRQKQAADVMAREMKKVGLELTHVIGPKTGHSYEKGAKAEVNRLVDEIVAKGRDPLPKEIKFVTYTLRYPECGGFRIAGMARHWEPAGLHAKRDGNTWAVTTTNVTHLRLPAAPLTFVVDGTTFTSVQGGINNLTRTYVKQENGGWGIASSGKLTLHKSPGLQGPIDDAFMDAFVMVKPTGQPLHEAVGKWAEAEMTHALTHWRKQFRGDAKVIADTDALPDANLVLWGDPSSNAVLRKIADKLPVKWTADGVVVGDQTYPAGTHVPVLIYPNPLNPKRYVVINSGFTFREYDYLNNARQVPKLPDYAVVDVTTPPNSRYPGKVVRAGFFGEKWELLPNDGK